MIDWLAKLFIKNYTRVGDRDVRLAYGRMAGIVCIICNVVLCILKALVGLAAGSAAIVADAINNLSDASSNVITLFGFKLASRPADSGHPFGHGRYEYVAGLVVSVLVSAVGIELVRTGFERIVHPEPVEMSIALAVVLVMSIVVKLWMMSFNRMLAHRIESDTLEATAIDSRNDVLTTSAVLVCTVISAYTGLNLDGWASLAIGIFVLVSGVQLVRDALNPLLGAAPNEELVERMSEKVLSYPGVLGIHKLMIHDYGPGHRFASVHVEMAAEISPLESHEVIDNIERDFLANDDIVMTVHYDPIVTNESKLYNMRKAAMNPSDSASKRGRLQMSQQ